MDLENVLIRPLLTEKSNLLQNGVSGFKKYTFQVASDANKFQVMQAVKALFQVEPLACNICWVKSRKKRNLPISKKSFQRGYGVKSPWKKAVVTLPKGRSIEALESLGAGET